MTLRLSNAVSSHPNSGNAYEDDEMTSSPFAVRNKARLRPRQHPSFWNSLYSSQPHQVTAVVLALVGCILLLLVIIAWLVVLLVLSQDSFLVDVKPRKDHEHQAMQYIRNDIDKAETIEGIATNDSPLATNASLQIVWLMSFPNSGTSYTSQLVRDTTQTFTASNYADETPDGLQGIFEPVFPHAKHGPFWTIPAASRNEYTKPSSLVLTKTHCGIRCSLCSPNEYAETTYSFRRRCLVTKWLEANANGQLRDEYSTYSSTHVTKAVHLIRNPFDNVVSRFHLECTGPNKTAHGFAPNRHGFLRYCLSIDYKYTEQEIKYMHFQENKLLQDLWRVPCHADFVKYVEWHNLAFVTTADLNLTTYVLHYDWYRTRHDAVLNELLSFLQLTATATPPLFVGGKSYFEYYSREEQLIVKRAFSFMASRETWEQVQVYFPSEE